MQHGGRPLARYRPRPNVHQYLQLHIVVGRASTARSKALIESSKLNVSEISGFRSTRPERHQRDGALILVGIAEHRRDP